MARTQAQVNAFLNTLIGTIVVNKPDRDYDGQCVTLIKALLEYLGVPNPYMARGNAKDVGDTLIRQGIGVNGKGKKLTVVVNRDMGLINGIRYGHIWVDLTNLANYESNGRQALRVTKDTRPISQGQQFINLDKWIEEDTKVSKVSLEFARILAHGILGRNGVTSKTNALGGHSDADLKKHHVGRELTGQYIRGLYNSAEAKKFRSDLAALKKKADSAGTTTPAKVDKAVVEDYISKNLK